MPASTDAFSQILNTGIPIAVIAVFLFAIFKGFGVQIKAFLVWVGELFGYGKEAISDAAGSASSAINNNYDIVYTR